MADAVLEPAAPAEGGGDSHRGILRTPILLGSLLFARWDPACFYAGLAVFVAGLAVRMASKGYLRRRARVVTGGPYSRVRNPFYCGNALVDSGLLVMAGLPLAVPVYLALFLWIYSRTVREEERTLLAIHGEEYRAYCDAVPRYFPRLLPWKGGDRSEFRFKTVLREKELSRLVRLCAYPALLLVRMGALPGFYGRRELLLPAWAEWALGGGALACVIASRWIYRRIERRPEEAPPGAPAPGPA